MQARRPAAGSSVGLAVAWQTPCRSPRPPAPQLQPRQAPPHCMHKCAYHHCPWQHSPMLMIQGQQYPKHTQLPWCDHPVPFKCFSDNIMTCMHRICQCYCGATCTCTEDRYLMRSIHGSTDSVATSSSVNFAARPLAAASIMASLTPVTATAVHPSPTPAMQAPLLSYQS